LAFARLSRCWISLAKAGIFSEASKYNANTDNYSRNKADGS
jgi:hypothetical protein